MAAVITLDEYRVVQEARLALGAVGPTAFRAELAEAALRHRPAGREVLTACLDALQKIVADKLGDRASAPYKREAVRGVGEELFYQLLPEIYR